MEINAASKYDFEAIKSLTHLWMFKRADPKKRMIFWSIAYAILTAVVILEMIVFGFDTILMVVLGCGLLSYLLLCYLYFLLPKIQYNSLAKMKNIVNEYTFLDDKINIVTKSDQYNGMGEIKYSLIVKVMETSKYFFVYQNNAQVFAVDKSTVVGGTTMEIRDKLSSCIGDKYIICNY